MAFTNYITQIKDTASTPVTHDLVDTSASHYVKGTQTASTNAWTGALPDGVTAYYDGLSIDYFLPYAGISSAATLNLGSKGAKPVYYGNGTGAVTTHYPQYSVIHLTYIVNSALNSGNGCWKATGYYNTNTTYSAGTGLSLDSTTFNHSNSVTAGTAGTSSATSGSTLAVPYVTYDAQGHITASGTHTHTISGFLTSSSTLDATKLSGTIPSGCYTNTNTTYTLSNALASHKFTSTLTAGGSGSGTSTATMEFVAGTGITLTDDTTNKKITIACSVTNTDEKVKLTTQSTSGTYPLIFGPTSITSNSTYQGYYNTGITVNPSTKTVTATTFVGALTGTASGNLTSSSTLDATKLSGAVPAASLTNVKVSSSGSGNVITGLSASNGTITYTLGSISTTAAQIIRW